MESAPFDDALLDLRVTGSVLMFDTYAEPWAIEIPDEADLRELTGAGAETRVIPFHFVREGSFVLRSRGQAEVDVEAGQVAICPGGQSHVMALGKARKPVPFSAVINGAHPTSGPATTQSTKLLCGAFFLRAAPLNPLLAALPPLLTVNTRDAAIGSMLGPAITLLSHEVGGGRRNSFSALRLLEVFCAEAITAFRKGEGAKATGWFKALEDQRLAPALMHIHTAPGSDLSVAALAGKCAMSPSRFAARFRAAMGCSIMSYVGQWRMNLACRSLRETAKGLAEIAQDVSYEDVASFSRAFKSYVGQSPAHWRKNRGA